MNSKKTIVMLSALAALCLTSCNNDDEVSVNDGKVRFTAGIGREAVATPQSRAAGTAWHKGDEIGIFMVGHGTTDIAEKAENRPYTTADGTSAFTPVMGHEIYYPMDNSAVDFIAYYPHSNGAQLAAALPIEIALAQTGDTQRDTDLMWAKANNATKGYTKDAAATVDFTFGHCLSKLTMNCTVDASVGAASLLADATVTIKGMNTVNTFDLRTGMLSGTPGTPADIAPRKLAVANDGFHGIYDAIILPGAYADNALKVEFTIDGEPFVWDVEAVEFKPGHEYIYKVKITRTGVTATGTITPWTPVDKDEVTAD